MCRKMKKKAADLFQVVASIDSGRRMYYIANDYKDGYHVLRDEKKAVKLYQLAADNGNAHAIKQLAAYSEKGDEVTQDRKESH